MKLMIASDIHGSAYYCEKMIEAYKREKADKLLLLGDLLQHHGPRNDLPKRLQPKGCHCYVKCYEKGSVMCPRQLRHRSRPDGTGIPNSCRLLFY